MFEVSVDHSFAAGHALRNYKGACENVHGHNYKVRVTIGGSQLDSTGLLVDFLDMRAAIKAVVDRLDHRFLNDLSPFDQINPSAENLAKYFYDEITPKLSSVRLQIQAVTIWETDLTSATYAPILEPLPGRSLNVTGTWSDWRRFPDPKMGESLIAPIGPGCYDLRQGNEKVLCGSSKNVAFRMTNLLPKPLGQGTRNNAKKREYVLKHLGQIEYRTVSCKNPNAAKRLEDELRRSGSYLFPT
jgi:6-pyruvoyltetrahydropterin/6-carboxytetrahydropterin synthase